MYSIAEKECLVAKELHFNFEEQNSFPSLAETGC